MNVKDRLAEFLAQQPTCDSGVFIAPNAIVVGDVRIGKQSSIWYGSVLRGDINYIEIGNFSNLQDGVIGHLSDEKPLIFVSSLIVIYKFSYFTTHYEMIKLFRTAESTEMVLK